MYKVITEFHIGKYTVMILDKKITDTNYKACKIDGVQYSLTPIYDTHKPAIAVESKKSFLNKIVELI